MSSLLQSRASIRISIKSALSSLLPVLRTLLMTRTNPASTAQGCGQPMDQGALSCGSVPKRGSYHPATSALTTAPSRRALGLWVSDIWADGNDLPPFHLRFMAKSRAPFGSFCQSRLCSSAPLTPNPRRARFRAPSALSRSRAPLRSGDGQRLSPLHPRHL